MARRTTKIVIISILVLIVLTGTVIGILFATGVLGKKPASQPSPGPTPPPGPLNPVVNCDQMPNVSSFIRNLDGTYRMSFSPIAESCVGRAWYYMYYMNVQPGNHAGETQNEFKASPGQSFIDIDLDLPFDKPYSPVKWVQGFVKLRSDGANGPVYSNELPYVITNI